MLYMAGNQNCPHALGLLYPAQAQRTAPTIREKANLEGAAAPIAAEGGIRLGGCAPDRAVPPVRYQTRPNAPTAPSDYL